MRCRRGYPEPLRPHILAQSLLQIQAHWEARIFAGLHGSTALFMDWLFDGVTTYAAHYASLDGFDLSRRLWERYQDRAPNLKPGDEFGLADEFAEIVGLAGRYEWRRDPFAVADSFAA